jgi:hypothetical protein
MEYTAALHMYINTKLYGGSTYYKPAELQFNGGIATKSNHFVLFCSLIMAVSLLSSSLILLKARHPMQQIL